MTPNIETAVAEIKTYATRELQLLNQKTEKQIELKAAERLGGDALLDGAANDSIERAVRLQVELRQIDLAITSCRARRLAAVQQKLDAEVADLRRRAGEARQQSAEITSRSAPLLASIKEIEGIDHSPQGTSHSANAAGKAGILERQAAEMEQRGYLKHGHIEIDSAIFSLDEILQAVLEQAVDGPCASDLISWVQSQPKSATFAGNSTTCRFSWDMTTAAGILPASYIRTFAQPPAVAPPEAPLPPAGQLVSLDQFLGYAPKPRRDNREEQSA